MNIWSLLYKNNLYSANQSFLWFILWFNYYICLSLTNHGYYQSSCYSTFNYFVGLNANHSILNLISLIILQDPWFFGPLPLCSLYLQGLSSMQVSQRILSFESLLSFSSWPHRGHLLSFHLPSLHLLSTALFKLYQQVYLVTLPN